MDPARNNDGETDRPPGALIPRPPAPPAWPSRSRVAARPMLGAVAMAVLAIAGCSDDGEDRRRTLGASPAFADAMRVADPVWGGRLFGACAACHMASPGAGDRNGPNLYDVIGKPPAENSRRFGYTAALRSLGGTWTPERLDVWLAGPFRMVPGTSMRFGGVPDPLDRADIIAYLRTRSAGGSDRSAAPVAPAASR